MVKDSAYGFLKGLKENCDTNCGQCVCNSICNQFTVKPKDWQEKDYEKIALAILILMPE